MLVLVLWTQTRLVRCVCAVHCDYNGRQIRLRLAFWVLGWSSPGPAVEPVSWLRSSFMQYWFQTDSDEGWVEYLLYPSTSTLDLWGLDQNPRMGFKKQLLKVFSTSTRSPMILMLFGCMLGTCSTHQLKTFSHLIHVVRFSVCHLTTCSIENPDYCSFKL